MATLLAQALDGASTRGKFDLYASIRSQLWNDRSSFDSHWQQIADLVRPRRVRFYQSDRNRGDKRSQNIIDSTARFASRTLSSGLHAGLTSPARPWMKLTTPDPDLAEFGSVKAWLHLVTQRMLTVFAQTNLYNVLPVVYGDMGDFGTAGMSILEDTKDLFRAYSYPIGSFAIGIDRRGIATTFVNEYEMTVRQIVQEFGVGDDGRSVDWTKLSSTVKNLWDAGQYEAPVPVTWIVLPNDYRDDAKLGSKFLPWSSCHFEQGQTGLMNGKQFLRESGFKEFPLMCPRWDVITNDAYGTDCPGMSALGDVKQLQLEQRKKGQLLQKAVDPPLKGPSHLRTRKISLLPGDFTATDTRDGQQGLQPIHEVRLEGFQHITADIQDVRYSIQRAYYEDLFLMLANSDNRLGADRPTAREIDERHEEKLLALGPVLERTNDELLDPIVERVYAMMERAGLLPEPPAELHGVTLDVEYTSILHQAQKLVSVSVQDRFVQSVVGMAATVPDVLDKVDFSRIVDNYGEQLGVDPRVIRPTEEANQRIAQREQAMQQQAQAQQAQQLAGAAAAAGAKPVAPDSALDRVVSQMAG